jgi:hypothetical protein
MLALRLGFFFLCFSKPGTFQSVFGSITPTRNCFSHLVWHALYWNLPACAYVFFSFVYRILFFMFCAVFPSAPTRIGTVSTFQGQPNFSGVTLIRCCSNNPSYRDSDQNFGNSFRDFPSPTLDACFGHLRTFSYLVSGKFSASLPLTSPRANSFKLPFFPLL